MLRCGDWRRAGRRVVAGKRPAGRRQAVADAWRYSRAAEGSESRLQAAMCSALARDLGCRPGLSRQWARAGGAPGQLRSASSSSPARTRASSCRSPGSRSSSSTSPRRHASSARTSSSVSESHGGAGASEGIDADHSAPRAALQEWDFAHAEVARRCARGGVALTQTRRDTVCHGWGFAHVRRAPTRVGVRSRPSGVSPFRRAPQAAAGGRVSDLPSHASVGARRSALCAVGPGGRSAGWGFAHARRVRRGWGLAHAAPGPGRVGLRSPPCAREVGAFAQWGSAHVGVARCSRCPVGLGEGVRWRLYVRRQ